MPESPEFLLTATQLRDRVVRETDETLRLWTLDGRRPVRRAARAEQRRRGLDQTGKP